MTRQMADWRLSPWEETPGSQLEEGTMTMVGEPIKILHTRLGEFWSVNLERDSCPKVHLYTKKIGIMDVVKEKIIHLCIMIIFQKKTA